MKTIQLTPRQRNDISERRRQAQDRRIYQRLSAVLWGDAGRTRGEIAELVGVSTRQVGQWFRIFRNKGLDPRPANIKFPIFAGVNRPSGLVKGPFFMASFAETPCFQAV